MVDDEEDEDATSDMVSREGNVEEKGKRGIANVPGVVVDEEAGVVELGAAELDEEEDGAWLEEAEELDGAALDEDELGWA